MSQHDFFVFHFQHCHGFLSKLYSLVACLHPVAFKGLRAWHLRALVVNVLVPSQFRAFQHRQQTPDSRVPCSIISPRHVSYLSPDKFKPFPFLVRIKTTGARRSRRSVGLIFFILFFNRAVVGGGQDMERKEFLVGGARRKQKRGGSRCAA